MSNSDPRKSQNYEGIHDAMIPSLMSAVRLKTHRMITCYRRPSGIYNIPGHGQMRFIRGDPIQISPRVPRDFAVCPVTAKHNLRHINKDGIAYDALRTQDVWDEERNAGIVFG